MAAATEEEIEEAATVGDGESARADCRGRGNGREEEKGSQRGRDGVSRGGSGRAFRFRDRLREGRRGRTKWRTATMEEDS